MGLDLKTQAWVAYCFDEACFMWGRHVDAELREGTKKAKTDAQATSKAMMVMRRLMTPPEEAESSEEVEVAKAAPTGQFRDPAARMKG